MTELLIKTKKKKDAFQLNNTSIFTFFPWLTNASGSAIYCRSIKIKTKNKQIQTITSPLLIFHKAKIKK